MFNRIPNTSPLDTAVNAGAGDNDVVGVFPVVSIVNIVTPNPVSRKDIHKILMRGVTTNTLDSERPRSDAGVLFRMVQENKAVATTSGSHGFSTSLIVAYNPRIRFSARKSPRIVEVTPPVSVFHAAEKYVVGDRVVNLPVTMTTSATYTPVSVGDGGYARSVGKRMPIPRNQLSARISDMVKRRGVELGDDFTANPANNLDVRNPYVHDGWAHNKKPVDVGAVKSVTATCNINTTISGDVHTIASFLSEGVGKCRNYGLGLPIITG